MTDLQVFENEEFGKVRSALIDGEPWFVAADVCKALELSNPTVAVDRLDEDERAKFNLGRQGDATIVNEPGLYSLVLGSRKPEAKKFKRWITHDVIPAIRKTGGYVANEELFVKTYFSHLSPEEQEVIRATLAAMRKQNEIIQEQQKEIEYKEDVIIGLVDEISLAEKRQILNRLVRYKNANYKERWATLYREFENKYHINLSVRLNNYNKTARPKCKSKLDYIEKVMGKLPELYEIAVKLYENDVKALVQEMYYLNDGVMPQIEAVG